MERRATSALAVPQKEYLIFDSHFYRNQTDFNPRQRRGDRKNIEYYIERIHEQVRSWKGTDKSFDQLFCSQEKLRDIPMSSQSVYGHVKSKILEKCSVYGRHFAYKNVYRKNGMPWIENE